MERQVPDIREIVAGMLGDQRLLAACAARDAGALFRLLNHRGVGTRRIAAAVDVTQGRLYDYMNGKSRVEKLAIFEQIADAFHIPGHLLGLSRRPWEPERAESRSAVPESVSLRDPLAVDAAACARFTRLIAMERGRDSGRAA
ncbi:hypothetical protein [Streptomyces sp. NPDC050485]|uniref:hypothetical protein n=1 Tax=Streptomyces sp. NPDC050485 TaxID=3365617 RepID=UPI0037B73AC7